MLLIVIYFNKNKFISGSQAGFSGPLDVMSYDGAGALIRGASEFFLGSISFFISKTLSKNTKTCNLISSITSITLLVSLFNVGYDLIFVLSSFLLIPSLASSENLAAKILSGKISIFLGKISYSLYLCHIPLAYYFYEKFKILNRSLPFQENIQILISALIAVFLCIPIAWLSYTLIERKLLLTKISYFLKKILNRTPAST